MIHGTHKFYRTLATLACALCVLSLAAWAATTFCLPAITVASAGTPVQVSSVQAVSCTITAANANTGRIIIKDSAGHIFTDTLAAGQSFTPPMGAGATNLNFLFIDSSANGGIAYVSYAIN